MALTHRTKRSRQRNPETFRLAGILKSQKDAVFIAGSTMWLEIADFACSLGVSKGFISKVKKDLDELVRQLTETHKTVESKYTPEERNNSLSMQSFYPWHFEDRLTCFYMIYLSGFRHTALRELRFYLESSARAYYIDTEYPKTTYACKVNILGEVRWKRFRDLLKGLPKRNELERFYDDLCDYVHLSVTSQTDARDPSLNRALIHRLYVEGKDKEMLERTFDYSKYLLLALDRKHKQLSNSRKLPPQKP